jgi:2-succinyl-6-hydroxy-2,4-cyclohexadiene-1-carboxylate synthase
LSQVTSEPKLGSEQVGTGRHRIVMVHGFTQTRASWRQSARSLVSTLPDTNCLLVDLPGHGQSSTVSADLSGSARLLAAVGGRAVYVGYSLGARVVLQLMADQPDVVIGAVSVSGAAGIADDTERRARASADDELARRVETIGVAAFLREWLAQPIFASLNPAQAMVDERLTNTAGGLADSLRRCGQGRQRSLWNELSSFDRPFLAVAGAHDLKYVDIARRLAGVVRHGSLAVIPECGHSVNSESPAELVAEIAKWYRLIVSG